MGPEWFAEIAVNVYQSIVFHKYNGNFDTKIEIFGKN